MKSTASSAARQSRDDPYSRLYWRFPDEFPDVYDDDSAFALWCRLLRLGDMAWPAAAALPYGVKKAPLATLTRDRDGGPLVLLVTRTTFRIRGMDKERGKRSEAARLAAVARWGNEDSNPPSNADSTPTRNADGNAETMPRRDEKRRDETSRVEPPARTREAADDHEDDPWAQPEAEAMDWLRRHGCLIREGDGYHQRLIHAVERHGVNAMIGQFDRLARAGTKDGDLKGFLFVATDALDAQSRPNVRELEAEERREEQDEAFANRVAKTMAENRKRYPNLYPADATDPASLL